MNQEEQRDRFDDLVRNFSTAMLVTHAGNGELRGRPMTVASVAPDGDVWFATGINSTKADELLVDRRVAVVMQESSRFVSLTGEAEVVVNRAKATELWNEAWRPWFPAGPDDPELALVHVRAFEAEFWDTHGLRGARLLFDAIRHAARGERMGATDSTGTHGRIPMPEPPRLRARAPRLARWLGATLDVVLRRRAVAR
jgi:general stress protein 26